MGADFAFDWGKERRSAEPARRRRSGYWETTRWGRSERRKQTEEKAKQFFATYRRKRNWEKGANIYDRQ